MPVNSPENSDGDTARQNGDTARPRLQGIEAALARSRNASLNREGAPMVSRTEGVLGYMFNRLAVALDPNNGDE